MTYVNFLAKEEPFDPNCAFFKMRYNYNMKRTKAFKEYLFEH